MLASASEMLDEVVRWCSKAATSQQGLVILVVLAGVGLRQAVTKVLNVPVGLSLFVDSGQVWANHNDVRLDEIKVALGGGVLIGTPLGPIRLETAGNLGTPMHGDDRFEFHFAIGHPY